ncbi:efflux RND transporter periplasmic adaptor subunit [Ectobacillus ponti]|uniref:Efflux RND transporter periplasmic adaptor subunit n=1 Tax=Ectobacillus ponti TaxID=2961894 RepID=A0AA42BPH6_9BACI|nr:efflux RND transporter periplasmic adaptor subunit [Ectobacillus ponti]MCP8967554.1 efflux RND transporter periplasmic adaptor subunit [Ectobacillus ponti]
MSELALNQDVLLKPRRSRKWMWWLLAAAIIIGAVVYFTLFRTSAPSTSQQVQYMKVKRGDVAETVSASGTVQAGKQVSLNAASNNVKLTAVNVKVGDHVQAGQALAVLDNSSAKVKVTSAQAAVASAQSRLDKLKAGPAAPDVGMQQISINKAQLALASAKDKYDQVNAQYTAGKATDQDVKQADTAVKQAQQDYDLAQLKLQQLRTPASQADLQSAQADLEQAKAQLQQSQSDLDALTIKAPMDGLVVTVNGNVGETPANNNPVLVLDNSDAAQIQVSAQVSQSDIGKLQKGMTAAINTSAYDNKTFTGQVDTISPAATTQSGVTTYNVLLTVDNSGHELKPGMTTNVTVEIGKHTNVLYIPTAALRDFNGKSGVLVEGTASTNSSATRSSNNSGTGSRSLPSGVRFKSVEVGFYSTDKVEITSGLAEGDRVAIIFNTQQNSQNGQRSSLGGFGGSGFGGSGFGGTNRQSRGGQ